MKKLTCMLCVVGSSAVASANAFNINEHDAKVTGRGDTSAATDTGPSSIVFNPGGIAVGEGTSFAIGGSLIAASGSYTLEGTTDKVNTTTDPAVVPALFVTSRVHEMISIGIGMHFPFGLAIAWPAGHPQQDVIQEQQLRTYFITPSVGLNLDKQVPGLTLGAGVDIVPATVELRQTILFGDATGTAHLGGDALGVGARFGAMYRPHALDQLHLGVMYRSPVKLNFGGKADFDIDNPQYRSQLPSDGDITTTITLPQSVVAGVGYDVTPELQFELNMVWIDWSVFDELRINLPDDQQTVSPEKYHDTFSWRLGGEYALTQYKAAVRAGFIYDPSPIPAETLSAQLPDTDRKNITLGASKYFGNYGAHLGLLWVTPSERKTSDTMYMPQYKATYGVQAFVANVMFSGTFGN